LLEDTSDFERALRDLSLLERGQGRFAGSVDHGFLGELAGYVVERAARHGLVDRFADQLRKDEVEGLEAAS